MTIAALRRYDTFSRFFHRLKDRTGFHVSLSGPRLNCPIRQDRTRTPITTFYHSFLRPFSMKFSHSLQLNSVPEWVDHYVDYGLLKKAIYEAEKLQLNSPVIGNRKSEISIPLKDQDANRHFLALIDKELTKVTKWYDLKSAEFLDRYHRMNLEGDDAPARRRGSTKKPHVAVVNEKTSLLSGVDDENPRHSSMSVDLELGNTNIYDVDIEQIAKSKASLKERLIDIFVKLSEIRSFADLNWEGIRKALKKYDKVTGNNLKTEYLDNVASQASPYQKENVHKVKEAHDSVVMAYARLTNAADERAANRELSSYLKDVVVYERNTVWRDMVSRDRRQTTLHVEAPADEVDKSTSSNWKKFINKQVIVIPIALLILLLSALFLPIDAVEPRLCLSILIFASIMWCSEAIPLFVTAMIVPALIVFFRVYRKTENGQFIRMTAHEATKQMFADMFSTYIMLLLGGFTIAAALSKYNIAKLIATQVLSRAGTRPGVVLLANMFVATFLSMWISNVAAPVLCFSLIQPILRTLPRDSHFSSCLILGIALASNLGGMASPIASPQNLITIDSMKDAPPSWAKWFAVALPIVILGNLATWAVLMGVYRPWGTKIVPIRAGMKEKFIWKHWFIIIITLVTIILWCAESSIENYVGDMSILAILPLAAFFGAGILSKDDFNSFLWTVVMLAMGGAALGKAVASSGLLNLLVSHVSGTVDKMSIYAVYVVLTGLVMVVATFISHTVSALVILPVVYTIGLDMGRSNLLVFGCGLCCSAGMGLIVSGFPNINAAAQEDEVGRRYLTSIDFIKSGVPASILVWGLIISIGYGTLVAVGY
ncbi:hypothetical protein PROFUN_14664 [Planoprotostelium fungivorum]|uniref:SPX domain-containing protein n=1 Tax=Planoprotostelium fungivorum TaxID=1890364 RepID=A0A2P6MZ47_9EUKA|nr:hypothetical protein PROFUN_14664 [Planoprotostelium fungivorum]